MSGALTRCAAQVAASLIEQQASIPPAQNKMLSITLDLTMRQLVEADYHSNFLRLLNQVTQRNAPKECAVQRTRH